MFSTRLSKNKQPKSHFYYIMIIILKKKKQTNSKTIYKKKNRLIFRYYIFLEVVQNEDSISWGILFENGKTIFI